MRSQTPLAWVPLVVIGVLAVGSGLGWLLSPEPWLLDRGPNERLLRMSFQQLAERVPTVFDYLRTLYKFFGLWVLGLGLFIIVYGVTAYRRSENNTTANTLFLAVLGFLLIVQTVFLVYLIPDSPFLWVDLFALLLWTVAVTAYTLARPTSPSVS